jgi:hypothetical protein
MITGRSTNITVRCSRSKATQSISEFILRGIPDPRSQNSTEDNCGAMDVWRAMHLVSCALIL